MNFKKILILIIILLGIINLKAQTCNSSGPIYFAIKKAYIYEHSDIDSAIKGEVPVGNEVIVTNSFFGKMGWWEICYEEKRGWVKKSLLSKSQIIKKDNTNSKEDTQEKQSKNQTDTEVGFSPFLGKTSSSVNFRTSPTIKSNVIRQISNDTLIYIISETAINDFYKAIDLETGNIGWINKKLVVWYKSVDTKSTGGFQSTGKTSTYNSEVRITNKSSVKITLVVGNNTFYLAPNSTETKFITPGNTYYIATAPRVIPTSGYHNFGSYEGYEWKFWIETKRK
ncbi:SH3 domain-containing protein [Chryseobacterium indologenes]|uniref:hypothetical protein n=1 Tax=Chryseobacterium indologenes TaxID=253 RepID=UPI00257911E4|nr:hypothetical protein [Chryseobacterium indologenes]MDM1554447.1 SH3 domain-containing protein [Chryseobacterium indologenes]